MRVFFLNFLYWKNNLPFRYDECRREPQTPATTLFSCWKLSCAGFVQPGWLPRALRRQSSNLCSLSGESQAVLMCLMEDQSSPSEMCSHRKRGLPPYQCEHAPIPALLELCLLQAINTLAWAERVSGALSPNWGAVEGYWLLGLGEFVFLKDVVSSRLIRLHWVNPHRECLGSRNWIH